MRLENGEDTSAYFFFFSILRLCWGKGPRVGGGLRGPPLAIELSFCTQYNQNFKPYEFGINMHILVIFI
jgi:hypothetical protein